MVTYKYVTGRGQGEKNGGVSKWDFDTPPCIWDNLNGGDEAIGGGWIDLKII